MFFQYHYCRHLIYHFATLPAGDVYFEQQIGSFDSSQALILQDDWDMQPPCQPLVEVPHFRGLRTVISRGQKREPHNDFRRIKLRK